MDSNSHDFYTNMTPAVPRCVDSKETQEIVRMSFKDAPVGARFKYPYSDKIWVKLNSYPKGMFHDGNGLICEWVGNKKGVLQHYCSFVDEAYGVDFDTEIELI